MKATAQARNVIWSLRWLTGVALILVLATIVSVGWTLSQLRQERRLAALEQRGLDQAVRELRETSEAAIQDLHTIFDHQKAATNRPTNAERFAALVRGDLKFGDHATARHVVRELTQQTERLTELSTHSAAWLSRYLAVGEDRHRRQALGQVRSLLAQLRTTIDGLEGRRQLEDALQFRQWRALTGEAAALQAGRMLRKYGERQSRDTTDFKSQLAEVARAVEQLGGEEDLDNLANLTENQIKPALERLQRSLLTFQTEGNPEEGIHSQAVDRLRAAILDAPGSLLGVHEAALELRREREWIKDQLLELNEEIYATRVDFAHLTRTRDAELSAQLEASLAVGWHRLIAFALIASGLFVWLARLMARGIHSQVVALQAAHAAAEQSHRSAQRLAEEQRAGAERLASTLHRLRASERRFRALSNAAPIGIFEHDSAGECTYVNSYAQRALGRLAIDCMRDGWRRLVHPEDLVAVHNEWQAALRDGATFAMTFRVLTSQGEIRWLHAHSTVVHFGAAEIIGRVGTVEDITARRQAEELMRLQEAALRSAANVMVITNRKGNIVWANPAFTTTTGYALEEVVGRNPRILRGAEPLRPPPPNFYADLWRTIRNGRVWHGEFYNRRKDGMPLIEDATITPVRDLQGVITHYVAVKQDITERKHQEEERALLEVHLHHSQKLESIGRLAAGIAHEINTPTQFVGDNLRFMQESLAQLQGVLALPSKFLSAARGQQLTPDLLDRAEATLVAADLDYISAEMPRAIEESLQGIDRVAKIVLAMKEFSHPGTEEKTLLDLNKALESTLTVARNEWKYVAELVTDFDPHLPLVMCLPGEFNQAILNLVVNAAHAIGDVFKDGVTAKGTITVSTRRDGEWAEVRIADTGTGIPEAARNRIFTPFFTTKGVGKGTGQGLAIARSVIVDKHGGTIAFETETGKGTTFHIRLPLRPVLTPAAQTA